MSAYHGATPAEGMNAQGINWDDELKKLEREYDGLPPLPSRTQIRMERIQEIVQRGRAEETLTAIGIWIRLVLVAGLTTGLFWWPYGRACGWPLTGYLVSHVLAMLVALIVVILAWRARRGWAFSGAAVCFLVAWTMFTLHARPHVHVGEGPGRAVEWICTD